MQAKKGDWLVVESSAVDRSGHRGLVLDVEGPDGTPPFLVRWEDNGHEGLIFRDRTRTSRRPARWPIPIRGEVRQTISRRSDPVRRVGVGPGLRSVPPNAAVAAAASFSRNGCVTVLIEAVEKIAGRSLKLFGVSPVLVGLLFVCGQPFADSAQQRREGAHFGLGQYYLGCHDRSPSAAAVLLGPCGTTSILRRCGSHKGTIAQNNRGPSTRSSVGARGRPRRGMPEGYRPSATARREIP
jgi:hypothetical protein